MPEVYAQIHRHVRVRSSVRCLHGSLTAETLASGFARDSNIVYYNIIDAQKVTTAEPTHRSI